MRRNKDTGWQGRCSEAEDRWRASSTGGLEGLGEEMVMSVNFVLLAGTIDDGGSGVALSLPILLSLT
jgi:hypothetical protein